MFSPLSVHHLSQFIVPSLKPRERERESMIHIERENDSHIEITHRERR